MMKSTNTQNPNPQIEQYQTKASAILHSLSRAKNANARLFKLFFGKLNKDRLPHEYSNILKIWDALLTPPFKTTLEQIQAATTTREKKIPPTWQHLDQLKDEMPATIDWIMKIHLHISHYNQQLGQNSIIGDQHTKASQIQFYLTMFVTRQNNDLKFDTLFQEKKDRIIKPSLILFVIHQWVVIPLLKKIERQYYFTFKQYLDLYYHRSENDDTHQQILNAIHSRIHGAMLWSYQLITPVEFLLTVVNQASASTPKPNIAPTHALPNVTNQPPSFTLKPRPKTTPNDGSNNEDTCTCIMV